MSNFPRILPSMTECALQKSTAEELIAAAQELRRRVGRLKFDAPVACVYNPLDYAWAAHEIYLRRYGDGAKRVIFLGMNPGPFGMTQTGVPFGEVAAVRDWLGIRVPVEKPACEHARRPIEGFDCERSEVSGRRLWGLFAQKFSRAENFFRDHFVVNYCPLTFLEVSGKNLTPDKLPKAQREELHTACDAHLRRVIEIFQPEWLIGVGDFAENRARLLFENSIKIGKILHPSPASPSANNDWAGKASRQLCSLGVWS